LLLKEAGKVGPHSPFPKVFAVLDAAHMQAIVMEAFLQDLRSWLHGNVPTAHFQQSAIRQLGGALAHLHKVVKIVHLDVKAANILLDIAHNRTVLCDFSCAEKIQTTEASNRMHVTLHYRPMEFFVHSHVPSCLLQPAADLWSFGCMVWELGARGYTQKPFRHFFQSDHTEGVQRLCQNYVNVVHGAARCLPGAYWINRLAEAGAHSRTVKRLCHPRPQSRQLPNIVEEPLCDITASMFRG
jgi:serine/threonine protein kinase